MTAVTTAVPASRGGGRLALAALAGGAVAIAIGTYGRVHDPTGGSITRLGFPTVLSMKAWLATGAVTAALFQVGSALAMWGRLPGVTDAPRWLPTAHRWSGTVAFLLSLPVAYHCLWALGFEDSGTRQVVHSIAGCLFYGAFATKLLGLRIRGAPKWAIPVIGGTLTTALVVLWVTSSLWFFTNVDFPGWS